MTSINTFIEIENKYRALPAGGCDVLREKMESSELLSDMRSNIRGFMHAEFGISDKVADELSSVMAMNMVMLEEAVEKEARDRHDAAAQVLSAPLADKDEAKEKRERIRRFMESVTLLSREFANQGERDTLERLLRRMERKKRAALSSSTN